MKVRLNKFLSESGIASRRKSEEFIKEGRVTINGSTVLDLAVTVDLQREPAADVFLRLVEFFL